MSSVPASPTMSSTTTVAVAATGVRYFLRNFLNRYVALGGLWERSAAVAATRRETARALEFLDRAGAMYGRALEGDPDHELAREGLARVRRAVASATSSNPS